MKTLIGSNNLDRLSIPFEVAEQITVFALGLEPGDSKYQRLPNAILSEFPP